jgi:hypothetical protein
LDKNDIGKVKESFFSFSFFLFPFDKSKYIKKVQRGATHSTQDVYKGKPKVKKISEKENPGN